MSSIIGLKKANCKNCYRCVKVCPVKSIRVADGQATIIDRSCILCGTCLERCPQNAKTLISHRDVVERYLSSGDNVILSIAPSYYGCFHIQDPKRFAGAVKALGFFGVSETSEGAAYVTAEYHRLIQENKMKNIITTCCPSFNRLVELYHPGLIDQLAPVVSPMIAHARLLKQRFPGSRVVFCGPCIAKIDEADDVRHCNEVDAVLTFEDLIAMLHDKGVSIETAEPASFLNGSSKILRMYPVNEGILASLRQLGDTGDWRFLSVSGTTESKDLCEALEAGELEHCVIEVNACRDGCVNGPAAGVKAHERFSSSVSVRNYALEDCDEYPTLRDSIPMHKTFLDRSPKEEIPDEDTIRAILAKIGKNGPEDELNCGSCGYPTCRAKAIAVFQGKAELEMCVPFMKERAESFANCLLAETPNITIMVDEELN
ncbi:MAG: 4Fe-4S dicluster domain-containing protein, partial [Clostridiales bacterium]|nr:4Fe-4S dicluster domain-containing protein [Clostridiales bacterium]